MKKHFILYLCAIILALFMILTGCDAPSEESSNDPQNEPLDTYTDTELETPSLTECSHVWQNATCTEPKTCSICKKSEGQALGHSWIDASCENPKSCSVCKKSEGQALGHSYNESIIDNATCKENGKKQYLCSVCHHSYEESYSLPAYDATAIHDMYTEIVGEIITFDKSGKELAIGSCFVYSSDGKIITNFHVVEDAFSIKVIISNITYNIQYIIAYDRDIDIAVLKINATNLKKAKICKASHAVGQDVYAFGSSKGLTATFSRGIITYSDRALDDVHYIQHDAAISSGNSGGPLINQYGEVIGINTLSVRDSQNLNLAISISELLNLRNTQKLTLSQFHQKECDPVTKLENFIRKNGTYKTSSSGNYYVVNLGYSYISDETISRYAYLFIGDNYEDSYITLDISYSGNYVYFKITDLDSIYSWNYFSDDDYRMSGILYANTYDDNTLLGYNSNNIYSSSLRSTIREIASSMMSILLSNITEDFEAINVTAEDLGFIHY